MTSTLQCCCQVAIEMLTFLPLASSLKNGPPSVSKQQDPKNADVLGLTWCPNSFPKMSIFLL